MKFRSIIILITSLCILIASGFIGTNSTVHAENDPFPPPPELNDSTIVSGSPSDEGSSSDDEISFIDIIEILINITI